MEMNTLKDMVLGKPAPLLSTFRLSYYSILNLMSRAEGQFTAEHVIKNSFHQFQYEKVWPISCVWLLSIRFLQWLTVFNTSTAASSDFTWHWEKSLKTWRRSCCARCFWRSKCFSFTCSWNLLFWLKLNYKIFISTDRLRLLNMTN